jgi:hypothetical protein
MVPEQTVRMSWRFSHESVRRLAAVILATLLGCRTPGLPIQSSGGLLGSSPTILEESLFPSNHRNWSPDLAVLPFAEFEGDRVRVHNIRDCIYESDNDYVVNYYDKTFDLGEVSSVDFLTVPFNGAPSLAHTMLSFGFSNGDHLGVSVEARLEEGESYSPIAGGLRQFELMYVVASERDLIVRRTKHRHVDVYLYPTIATPEQARAIFVDVMQRANQLYVQPEFYDTLTNNCATNIARHANRLRPGRVPYDFRILLPGLSDQLAYDLGLLRTNASFAATKRRSRITAVANRYADDRDFSLRIRR